MAQVSFTRHLLRFFPDLVESNVEADTLGGLIDDLDVRYDGLAHFVLDDNRRIRPHVNVFIDEVLVADRGNLAVPLKPETRIHLMQALSGG